MSFIMKPGTGLSAKGKLKQTQIDGVSPRHHALISEQRVSTDSRHPLSKQWHRRQGGLGRSITPAY